MLLCADIYDLIDVKRKLLEVAHNWKGVGEALRLKPALLRRIQANHPTDVTECLSAVLAEWLKKAYNTTRFGPPSWKLLVAAVADPAGGNDRALAERIVQRHKGKYYMPYVYFNNLYMYVQFITSTCIHVRFEYNNDSITGTPQPSASTSLHPSTSTEQILGR